MASGTTISLSGGKLNWAVNAGGQVTVDGAVVPFWSRTAPPSNKNKPVERGVPITINEQGISIGKIILDPNRFDSISLMEKKGFFPNVVISYQDGNELANIWVTTNREDTAKDFLKIFPAIIDAAKSINVASIQMIRQQQAEAEAARQHQLELEQQKRVAEIEMSRIEKLKKLVQVSKKVKVSQMAQMLNLHETALNDRIVDWAAEFGFILDGDFVEFGAGRKDDFIASLDEAFADWGKKTQTKEGKLE